MRTYLWDGLIIRYVSLAGSLLSGIFLVQCNVFQFPTTLDLGAIASIIWLVWFLWSSFAFWTYCCPRCGKRFFKFRYYQVSLADLVRLVSLFRGYPQKKHVRYVIRCRHCNLPIWAKSDAGNDSEEGKFTPPLP